VKPLSDYDARLKLRQQEADRHNRSHLNFGNVRLVLGIAAAVLAYSAFVTNTLSGWWILLPAALFIPTAILHDRVLRKRELAQRAVRFCQQGIARIRDTWHGTGETGDRFRDDTHPYSGDLDLFGPSSLFQLLSCARTRAGEEKLARWLLAPASRDEIIGRQQSVAELRDYMDLRESMFVLGEDARDTVRTDHLISWGESPAVLRAPHLRIVATILTALVILTAAARKLLPGDTLLLTLTLAAVGCFGLWLRQRVLAVLVHMDEAVRDLGLLSKLLRLVEDHSFVTPHLLELQKALTTSTASKAIARLNTLSHYNDNRHNPFMRVVGPPLLYGTHLAFAVENWRRTNGPHIRAWLESLSELEALLSLAAYSFEHPDDPFPEFINETSLEGHDLGHPLLPQDRCVRNPVELGAQRALYIVSGSNMSGKSTFLRTIGINVVLAMAGSAVRARRLRLCPLQTGASIRVTDSLQGGSSRFFAEITRLRKIVDLTSAPVPVLFMLDELLNGTNSHDRAIGAEGILRELIARKAIGLVTTHDLALTVIAEKLGARVENVHFQDSLTNGQLQFDYRVRPGIIEKSNALELMRSIGLDV